MWDIIPCELQDRIVKLASYEDRLEKSRKNVEVCKDIRTYHDVKEMWKLGHIRCAFHACNFKSCTSRTIQTFNFKPSSTLYHFHLCVYGHVTRRNGSDDKAYLGWSLSNADLAIPYMKAFLVRKVKQNFYSFSVTVG